MVSFITIHDSQRTVSVALDVFVNGCLYRSFTGYHFPEKSFALDVFVNGCLYRSFTGYHFPEKSFDLFSQAVFI